jgi:hypothetical protein
LAILKNVLQYLTTHLIFFQAMLFCLLACEKLEVEEKAFFFVEMESANPVSLNTVSLRAQVKEIGSEEITDFGFIVSFPEDDTKEDTLISKSATDVALDDNSRIFTHDFFDSLDITQTYYVRAYANLRERQMLSDTLAFNFSSVFISIDTSNVQSRVLNNTLFLNGNITGLTKFDSEIEDFGFLYSEILEEVQNGSADEQKVGSGIKTDIFFSDTIRNLSFNKPVYAAAYMYVNYKRILSQNIMKADIKGGWELVPSSGLPVNMTSAGVWVIGDRVYYGLGCSEIPCKENNAIKSIWEFDPDSGTSTHVIDLEEEIRSRQNFVSFSYRQKIYFGLGRMESSYREDFFSYDTETGNFSSLPSFLIAREGAFAVVIEGIVYVGGGVVTKNKDPEALNDVYSLDLNNPDANWKNVANIPFSNPNKPCYTDLGEAGRSNAMAFELNGNLYLGLGQLDEEDQALSDIYVLKGPSFNNWEHVGCHEALLNGPSYFKIDNRIFFGNGIEFTTTNFKTPSVRWWEFTPNGGSHLFIERTPFLGPPRWMDVHFSDQENGFILGGQREVFSIQDGGTRDLYYGDIWAYTPPKN